MTQLEKKFKKFITKYGNFSTIGLSKLAVEERRKELLERINKPMVIKPQEYFFIIPVDWLDKKTE